MPLRNITIKDIPEELSDTAIIQAVAAVIDDFYKQTEEQVDQEKIDASNVKKDAFREANGEPKEWDIDTA